MTFGEAFSIRFKELLKERNIGMYKFLRQNCIAKSTMTNIIDNFRHFLYILGKNSQPNFDDSCNCNADIFATDLYSNTFFCATTICVWSSGVVCLDKSFLSTICQSKIFC